MILCKTKSLWKVYETNAFYMRYTFEKEFGYGKGEGNGEDEIIFNFFLTDLEQYTAHWLSFYHGVIQCSLLL